MWALVRGPMSWTQRMSETFLGTLIHITSSELAERAVVVLTGFHLSFTGVSQIVQSINMMLRMKEVS